MDEWCFVGLQDQHMKQAEWQMSRVTELDLTSTELSADCLQNILCRAGAGFTYLGLGYCEFFNDQVSFERDRWLNLPPVGRGDRFQCRGSYQLPPHIDRRWTQLLEQNQTIICRMPANPFCLLLRQNREEATPILGRNWTKLHRLRSPSQWITTVPLRCRN